MPKLNARFIFNPGSGRNRGNPRVLERTRTFIAPGAQVDDGELDLVAVKAVNVFNLLSLTARLFLRSFDRSPAVLRLRGEHFNIRRGAPGIIHTDGEIHETGAEIDVLIKPCSLRVMTPV